MQPCLEKMKIASCFSRAANTYDSACSLQRLVGRKLLAYLQKKSTNSRCVLDVGSGTGYFSNLLAIIHPKSNIFSIDISRSMLKTARKRLETSAVKLINADFDNIPLKNASADIIYSNMSFQWSLNLPKTLLEMKRLLKPGGMLLFSMPVLGSLCELINCLKYVNANVRTNQFISSDDLNELLKQVGLSDFHIHITEHIIYYDDVYDLLLSLKKTGANRIKYNNPKFCGKDYFDLLRKAYQKQYDYQHKVKTTYRIAYVIVGGKL